MTWSATTAQSWPINRHAFSRREPTIVALHESTCRLSDLLSIHHGFILKYCLKPYNLWPISDFSLRTLLLLHSFSNGERLLNKLYIFTWTWLGLKEWPRVNSGIKWSVCMCWVAMVNIFSWMKRNKFLPS